MSVLIKGMEMPKRCEDCFCYRHNAEFDYAYCCISSVNVLGHGNARLNNCPLVEVPTPHGDLIDRWELTETAMIDPGEGKYVAVYRADEVDKAPVVIEAEE